MRFEPNIGLIERESRDAMLNVKCDALIDPATMARWIYRSRRRRESALPLANDVFGEPAWDILLDLYVARADGRCVSVSSACVAACVPDTTGLRWVKRLERDGMITSRNDPADGRQRHVALSDMAWAQMTSYLSSLMQGSKSVEV